MSILSDRLKEQRLEKHMSQTEISNRLQVKQSLISRYESGDRQPSCLILSRLADIYGVSTDYLLGRTDLKHPLILSLYQEILNSGLTLEEIKLMQKTFLQIREYYYCENK